MSVTQGEISVSVSPISSSFYTDETRTSLRGHTDIFPVEFTNTTLAQQKIEDEEEKEDDDDETSRRYLRHRKKKKKMRRRRKKKKNRKKNRHGHGLFDWPVQAAKKSWIKLQKQLQKTKQQLKKNKYQQLETKSNAAPCAGTTNSICAVFNVGADTSDGATNGNSSGNNGNGSEQQQQTKKLDDISWTPEETEEPSTLEPTSPTFVSS